MFTAGWLAGWLTGWLACWLACLISGCKNSQQYPSKNAAIPFKKWREPPDLFKPAKNGENPTKEFKKNPQDWTTDPKKGPSRCWTKIAKVCRNSRASGASDFWGFVFICCVCSTQKSKICPKEDRQKGGSPPLLRGPVWGIFLISGTKKHKK